MDYLVIHESADEGIGFEKCNYEFSVGQRLSQSYSIHSQIHQFHGYTIQIKSSN